MTAAAFLAAWALHLVAAASPGPAILMAARVAVTEGLRTGLVLAVGIALGACVWAVAALFGLALLFEVAPALLWAFKLAGGAFLLWIAWKMWAHAAEPLPSREPHQEPRSALGALWLGVVTQLANPKPAVFFGAVFVGTVPPDAAPWVPAALVAMVFVNEALCVGMVARLFSLERTRRGYARLKRAIDRSFGAVLALLGLKIALT